MSTEIRFEYALSLPKVLNRFGISLVVSTYQAGKLGVISAVEDQLSVTFHSFDRRVSPGLPGCRRSTRGVVPEKCRLDRPEHRAGRFSRRLFSRSRVACDGRHSSA
jgi:hypothetical protein